MTVLILVLMLLSVNGVFVVREITTQATQLVKDQIDVSVYFSHDATDDDIKEVREYTQSFPEVVDSTFLDETSVLERFKEGQKDKPEILASLKELGENPLGPTLILKTREPEDYQKIIDSLSVPEYENIIVAKTFADTEKAIDRISTITRQVEYFSLATSAFFALVAFLIIFNTVRVAIYTQRVEISIKKLVGATNWFVRGPYIVEAIIFSVFSVAIAYSLVLVAAEAIDPFLRVIFSQDALLTNFLFENILLLASLQLGAVFIITASSSMFAMRRHLRV